MIRRSPRKSEWISYPEKVLFGLFREISRNRTISGISRITYFQGLRPPPLNSEGLTYSENVPFWLFIENYQNRPTSGLSGMACFWGLGPPPLILGCLK